MSTPTATADPPPRRRSMSGSRPSPLPTAILRPEVVIFDPAHQLLAEYDYEKSAEELVGAVPLRPRFFRSLQPPIGQPDSTMTMPTESLVDEIVTAALQRYFLRGTVASRCKVYSQPTEAQTDNQSVLSPCNDGHSQVRAAAIDLLTQAGDEQLPEIANHRDGGPQPYPVVAAGSGSSHVTTDSTVTALEAAGKLEEGG